MANDASPARSGGFSGGFGTWSVFSRLASGKRHSDSFERPAKQRILRIDGSRKATKIGIHLCHCSNYSALTKAQEMRELPPPARVAPLLLSRRLHSRVVWP
jgi:hypothetical protein